MPNHELPEFAREVEKIVRDISWKCEHEDGPCDACMKEVIALALALRDALGKIEALEKALTPFSKLWLKGWDRAKNDQAVWGTNDTVITVGDIREAIAAMDQKEKRR